VTCVSFAAESRANNFRAAARKWSLRRAPVSRLARSRNANGYLTSDAKFASHHSTNSLYSAHSPHLDAWPQGPMAGCRPCNLTAGYCGNVRRATSRKAAGLGGQNENAQPAQKRTDAPRAAFIRLPPPGRHDQGKPSRKSSGTEGHLTAENRLQSAAAMSQNR
jgi:hypothetical protein